MLRWQSRAGRSLELLHLPSSLCNPCARGAAVHPDWTGLGTNSLKKISFSHCAGTFFRCLVNQIRDLIQLKNNGQLELFPERVHCTAVRVWYEQQQR